MEAEGGDMEEEILVASAAVASAVGGLIAGKLIACAFSHI